jgi:hypothetical protein
LLKTAVEQFTQLADENSGMKHPPGTAELLDWMLALLGSGAKVDADLAEQEQALKATYGSLVKSPEDRSTAKRLLGLTHD